MRDDRESIVKKDDGGGRSSLLANKQVCQDQSKPPAAKGADRAGNPLQQLLGHASAPSLESPSLAGVKKTGGWARPRLTPHLHIAIEIGFGAPLKASLESSPKKSVPESEPRRPAPLRGR